MPAAAEFTVVSDAAGRLRLVLPELRGDVVRAVAIEDEIDKVHGVRAVHAYPRTASVVVWYSPKRCDRSAVLAALARARSVSRSLVPIRKPRSADVGNIDVVRIVLGGAALVLLGVRRYVFARPPLLGPASRTFASGVTIVTGYPFLRGPSGPW